MKESQLGKGVKANRQQCHNGLFRKLKESLDLLRAVS